MTQQPPKGDRRYRVHRSAKFYVGELRVGTAGGTWFFTESAERVVYLFPGGVEKVVYRSRYYPLRPASEMAEIVRAHLALGAGVAISGRDHQPDDDPFEPHEFIDITPPDERSRFSTIMKARADST
ncbi:MAG: hypothetical protein ACLGHU_12455 [Alphaproteobacteria bacterium]